MSLPLSLIERTLPHLLSLAPMLPHRHSRSMPNIMK